MNQTPDTIHTSRAAGAMIMSLGILSNVNYDS